MSSQSIDVYLQTAQVGMPNVSCSCPLFFFLLLVCELADARTFGVPGRGPRRTMPQCMWRPVPFWDCFLWRCLVWRPREVKH